MDNKISNRQVFFLLFLALTTYTVINLPKILAQNANTGGWVTILLTAVPFALFAAIVIRLSCMFEGQVLHDYSRAIVGNFVSGVICLYFLIYFFAVATYLILQLTSTLKAEFYPITPIWATLIISVIVFAYMSLRGIKPVARFFEIVGPICLVMTIATHIAMLLQGNIKEILPLFQPSKLGNYVFTVKDTIIAFLGIEILTVIPITSKNPKRTTWTAILSVLFVALFYVLVVETCIMMLGLSSTQKTNYPLIEAIKLVENPVIERFDAIYLTAGFSGLAAGLCGVYLALVEYCSRMFPHVKRPIVVIGIGVFLIVFCLIGQAFDGSERLFHAVLPIGGLIAVFVIPAALYVIAKVKKLDKTAH